MKKFTAEQKLKIYQEAVSGNNKAAVARKYGIDRSYLYEIINHCNKTLLSHLENQKSGRKKSNLPETYDGALEKIKQLEEQNYQLQYEKEKYYVKSEFQELRLSWYEQDEKKKHLKKRKKKRS